MAAFEMDEIFCELRDRSAGLNCSRWDFIHSVIKKFAEDPACVMPDRARSGMLDKKLAKLPDAAGDGGRYDNAANLFRDAKAGIQGARTSAVTLDPPLSRGRRLRL